MATLQRSSNTFRREGSSGTVWDERLLIQLEDLVKLEQHPLEDRDFRHSHSVGGPHIDVLGAHAEVPSPYIRSFSAPPKKLLPLPPKSVRRKLASVFGRLPVK